MNVYYVQPGDTFYELANRFNIPLEALITANDHIDDPDRVAVGTKICVPSPMVTRNPE
nr:LysM domain-containing protein [Anaerobacillus arseniciselenatis]